MSDGLLCLRHDVVISSYNDNGNIRYLSTTGTHSGKGLVTRRIQEGHMASVWQCHVIGTDVLRNTTGLTGNNIGLTDIVQQRGLTVVNMTHDGNNGSAWNQIFLSILHFRYSLANLSTYIFSSKAELLSHKVDGLGIHTLVDADHDTNLHTGTDNLSYRHVHHGSQLVGCHELGKLQYLAFCCFVLKLLLHTLTDGITLLTTVLGTLTHLIVLVGKTSQCFANLLCYLFLANLGLQEGLLLLLVLFLATAVVVLLPLVVVIVLIVLLGVLRLVGHVVHIHTLLASAQTLLTFALSLLLLSTLLIAFTTFLFFALLLRTSTLVQAVQVNLSLNGKTWSRLWSRRQTEDTVLLDTYFLLLLLLRSRLLFLCLRLRSNRCLFGLLALCYGFTDSLLLYLRFSWSFRLCRSYRFCRSFRFYWSFRF